MSAQPKTAMERPLPNNYEAERAVLGAVLLDNKTFESARAKITTGDFFDDRHKRIFHAMTDMRACQSPIDLLTITDFLEGKRLLTLAGGPSYVASLTDGVPQITNVEHYAAIVKEKSLLRGLIHAGHAVEMSAFEQGANPALITESARGLLLEESPITRANGNGNFELKDYGLVDFCSAEFPIPEHLVEQVFPRGGSALIVALPHRLKSWFTTAIALGCTREGTVLGSLQVRKPVRTMLLQVEDFPGQLQQRVKSLLATQAFLDCDPGFVRIIPREEINCGFHLPHEKYYQALLRKVEAFRADHVIMDVVRRIFHGDINSPKDTAEFLEEIDRLRDATGTLVTLVHHENKKGEEIMTAGAGSVNFPSWANVVIQFRRKTVEGQITHVEIEVDNKLAQSPEPMRMTLDLNSELPLRVENLEDGTGIFEAQERLGSEWTVRDLAEVLEVVKSNAQRRLNKWLKSSAVEKISASKRGRTGGLARYKFTERLPAAVRE